MSRKGDFSSLDSNLLDRIGRTRTSLSLDDIAAVVGDVLKNQKRQIIQHVGRMLQVEKIKQTSGQRDEGFRNLHRRLTMLEAEMRLFKRGMR
jgi:hypothetical protein